LFHETKTCLSPRSLFRKKRKIPALHLVAVLIDELGICWTQVIYALAGGEREHDENNSFSPCLILKVKKNGLGFEKAGIIGT